MIQDSPLAGSCGPMSPCPRRNWRSWQTCISVAGRPLRSGYGSSGASQPICLHLTDGWVCSYKLLPNGARQIVDFQIPGDILGLRSVLLRAANHNIEPITVVEASEVVAADLLDAFSRSPRLAAAVLWAASITLRRRRRPWPKLLTSNSTA